MNLNPYVRPALPSGGYATLGAELLAAWVAERDVLAKIADPNPEQSCRLVALAGKVARADSTANMIGVRETITRALSACDFAAWQSRLSCSGRDRKGNAVALIDELDNLELVFATAERTGLAVRPIALDAGVRQLIDELGWSAEATDYARVVGATLRPDLPTTDPLLARTTEKFVALLDIAEAMQDAETDLLPLRLPAIEPPTTPIVPGRIPELRGEFAFKAGTTPNELLPVPPYEWRSTDGQEAVLAVPRVPSANRTLTLVITRADDLIGKPVLLGGLRGVVAVGGIVTFDWDDVAAIGSKVEYLVVGSGKPWPCVTPES